MPASAQAPSSTASGRDSNGRFTRGNGGGPGNPFARKVAQLRSALIERVTEQDIKDIAEVLILQARTGDHAAIKLLFQYVLGKPAPAANPDTVEIEEFQQIYAPQREIMNQFPETMHTIPPGMVCAITRIINELCVGQLQHMLELPPEQAARALGKLGESMAGMGRGVGGKVVPHGRKQKGGEKSREPKENGAAELKGKHTEGIGSAAVEPPRPSTNGENHGTPAKCPSTNGGKPDRQPACQVPRRHGRPAAQRDNTTAGTRPPAAAAA